MKIPGRPLLLICGSVLLLNTAGFGQASAHVCGLPLPKRGDYLKLPIEKDFRMPEGERLPKKVDLSPYFPAAGDQGRYQSCTAWAIGYGLMTYDHNRTNGIRPDRHRHPEPSTVFSPGYLFNMVKRYAAPDTSANPCMHGVDMQATFTIACEWGNVPASIYGYEGAAMDCRDTVSPGVMQDALHRKLRMPVALYNDCDSCDVPEGPFDPVQWKYHLAQGEPILVGMFVDCTLLRGGDSAYAAGKPFTWNCPRAADDTCSGGHAIVCCGYDDADSTFLFFNSFGTKWGSAGYCKMTYRTLIGNCLQAFIFTGPINKNIKAGMMAQVQLATTTDTTTFVKLKAGSQCHLDGMGITLAEHDGKKETALVQLVDPVYGTVLRSVAMDDEVPRSVQCNDKLWIIRFKEPSWFSRLLGNKVQLSVEVDANDDEEFQADFERRMDTFRARPQR
ncbi:MAG: C1 family peptidase [Flavobacteriales bacterium]